MSHAGEKTGETLVNFTNALIKSGVVVPASFPF